MIATGESRTVATTMAWLRRLIQWRWAPLLTVMLLALCTQLALVSIHPVVPTAPDSREYLAMAARITHSGQITDPRRTPGYPAFLALIFLLSGGVRLGAVVFVQCALFFVAAAEVYLLASRLTRRPWIACLAAAPVALNVYMLDWAYSIRDEAFSYWLVVTLLLVTERLARRLRLGALAAFVALGALLILTRPLYIFLPALILIALAARGIGLGKARQHILALGLSLALVYGCVVGYMALNQAADNYFGVSYVGAVNLFGKVLEYHLQGQPVTPALQPMQRRANAFVAHGGWDPWYFARDYHYTGDNYAPLGTYATYTIAHHPVSYAVRTLADMRTVLLIKPGDDARGSSTLAFTLSRVVARVELWLYLALPLVALWVLLLLRKGWRDSALFMVALLTLVVIAAIGMTAAAGYDEFYRLRSPIDWAYLVVFMLVALDVGGAARQWLSRRAHGA